MRDPKRIESFLERLKKIWQKNPDMRFAQVLGNVYPCSPYDYIDPYFVEDDDYLQRIEDFYSKPGIFRRFGKKRKKQ